MAKRFVPASGWTRWAAAACVAAAGFVGFQLWRGDVPLDQPPDQQTPAAQTGTAESEEPTTAGFEMKPSADFTQIVERPLFNRSRRPAPPEESKAAAGGAGQEAAAAKIALNGIVLAGRRRVALLRFDADPKVMHVAEGQQAGGWLIEKIGTDRVVLRRGQQASEIVLDYKRRGDQEAMPVPLPSETEEQEPMEGAEEPPE